MTSIDVTLAPTSSPFANAASRVVSAVKLFFDAFAEAQAQAAAARRRYPFID